MVVLKEKRLPEPLEKHSSFAKCPESSKVGESHDVGNPYKW